MTNKSKTVQCPHCCGIAVQFDIYVEETEEAKIIILFKCSSCGKQHSRECLTEQNTFVIKKPPKHSLDCLPNMRFWNGSIDDWKKKKAEFATEQIRRLQTPEARN